MYRKGTYLAYNNNVKQDGPCKKILCLYTDKRYDYIVRLSSAYLCDQNNVISLRHELLQYYDTGRFDLLKSAEMCSRYVKEVGIDSVLALEDVAAPILSSLVEKYGSFAFRGPSFESVFLTINKYYTRKLLDPNPVPYCHIDLNSHLESATLENMLNEVGLPAILKPACGTGSVLIQKINSFDDLLHAIESSKKHYSSIIDSHAPLSSKFLDLSRYPLALTDGLMILEKYVDGEIIELDGYVFNGKAYRWALYDLTTWPTHPNVNQMLFLPSTKPTHIQERIWDMFETVANRAADYGYDNHFMNMQLFLCKNGDVRLLEINGRMTTVCSPLCQKSLTSGDTIEAQLRLAQGEKPPPAKLTGMHSAYVSIRSTIPGKANEIIDFQVAESMENVNLHTGPDEYIQPVGDGGKSVGGAYLFADSREEIWQKHRDLYKRLFKKHPIGFSN